MEIFKRIMLKLQLFAGFGTTALFFFFFVREISTRCNPIIALFDLFIAFLGCCLIKLSYKEIKDEEDEEINI